MLLRASFGWQESVWLLGILGCAVFTYYACRTPEPARTALELASGLCDTSPSVRKRLIATHVAPELEVEDAEQELSRQGWSRSLLARELESSHALRAGCEVNLRDWEIKPQTGGAVWLEGVLEYSASQPSDLHALRRSVRARFREQKLGDSARGDALEAGRTEEEDARGSSGGRTAFQLEALVLGRFERRDPEARP